MSNGPQTIPANLQGATPSFLRAPWEFAVHAFVGTCIFAIIAAVAVGLDLTVHKLASWGISELILYGLRTAEGALFLTDLVLFGVFLWRTGKRTIQKL